VQFAQPGLGLLVRGRVGGHPGTETLAEPQAGVVQLEQAHVGMQEALGEVRARCLAWRRRCVQTRAGGSSYRQRRYTSAWRPRIRSDRAFAVTGRPGPAPAEKKGAAVSDWDREIGAMTLFVPDLDRARQFYQDVFGLQAQGGDEETAIFRFKNVFVFLHRAATAQELVPEVLQEAHKGAGQFAIIVDDADAVCSELTAHGAEFLSGPADRPWGMRTATFADPGGHIWEIAQELPADAG
jgi:catechol 2,3-dioxygenase-like lactoylglutathione lyase family enzyme